MTEQDSLRHFLPTHYYYSTLYQSPTHHCYTKHRKRKAGWLRSNIPSYYSTLPNWAFLGVQRHYSHTHTTDRMVRTARILGNLHYYSTLPNWAFHHPVSGMSV